MFNVELHVTHLNLSITAVTSTPQCYCLLYSSPPLTPHPNFVIQFMLKNYSFRETFFWVRIWYGFATRMHSDSSNLIKILTFSRITPLFLLASYLKVSVTAHTHTHTHTQTNKYIYIFCRCNHIMLQITLNNHLHICHVLWLFNNTIHRRQCIAIRRI